MAENEEEYQTESDNPAAGGDPNAGGNVETGEETAPISVIQSIRGEMQEIKDKLLITEAALREARAKPAPELPEKPAEADGLAGLDDNDITTVGQLRQIKGFVNQLVSQKETEFNQRLEQERLMSLPDFQEVLKTHWPNVVKDNPEFSDLLVGLSPTHAARLAYKLGIKDPGYVTKKSKPPVVINEPTLNPDRVRSPAAAGAAVPPKVEDAEFWNSMDDKDFDKMREKKRQNRRT